MNPILLAKLNELDRALDYECWYLVKQPTDFGCLCYLVSFLKEYQDTHNPERFHAYISRRVGELNAAKPNVGISDNYRALRVAAFFGLITMTSAKYDEAKTTDTFREITARCGGAYEETERYSDIIQRQIEKIYISTPIDEEYQGVRRSYRLYPVMLLYKVLLELGRATGRYAISMTEYRYLVATTKTYEGFLDTLFLIRLLRNDLDGAAEEFEKYRGKFDNRMIQALKQLKTLKINNKAILLAEDKIDEVAKTVCLFEKNPNAHAGADYLRFLGSGASLQD